MGTQHPGTLILSGYDDFYKTYGEDTIESAEILGIILTRRNNGNGGDSIEMAGFPHHALDAYLSKLIRAGKRVAVCGQLEDPKGRRKEVKDKKYLSAMDKMVKRGITKLITPDVATSDNVLNYRKDSFFAAVHPDKGSCGISFLDISTGEFLIDESTFDYAERLLGNFQPKGVLLDRARKRDFECYFDTHPCTFEVDDWVFTGQTA